MVRNVRPSLSSHWLDCVSHAHDQLLLPSVSTHRTLSYHNRCSRKAISILYRDLSIVDSIFVQNVWQHESDIWSTRCMYTSNNTSPSSTAKSTNLRTCRCKSRIRWTSLPWVTAVSWFSQTRLRKRHSSIECGQWHYLNFFFCWYVWKPPKGKYMPLFLRYSYSSQIDRCRISIRLSVCLFLNPLSAATQYHQRYMAGRHETGNNIYRTKARPATPPSSTPNDASEFDYSTIIIAPGNNYTSTRCVASWFILQIHQPWNYFLFRSTQHQLLLERVCAKPTAKRVSGAPPLWTSMCICITHRHISYPRRPTEQSCL